MSDQSKPIARVTVVGDHIDVGCTEQATRLPLDSKKKLRDQISSAVFAHERQCGTCDTTEAYKRGSPEFFKNIEAAHYTQDQIDRAQGKGRGES